MKTKIQKLLTTLLVLPILFGVCFANITLAKITCNDKEHCQQWIDSQSELFQEADALSRAFDFCLEACGLWDYSDWSKCSVQYEAKKTSCSQIATNAKNKTGEVDYLKISEKLNDLKTILGSQVFELKRLKNGYEGVEVNEVLSIEGQENTDDLEGFLGKSIDLLVGMVGLVAFVFLIIGGFRLLAAAGNDNEIQKAKTMLTYSIIGLAVALLAYIIVAAVQGILYS